MERLAGFVRRTTVAGKLDELLIPAAAITVRKSGFNPGSINNTLIQSWLCSPPHLPRMQLPQG